MRKALRLTTSWVFYLKLLSRKLLKVVEIPFPCLLGNFFQQEHWYINYRHPYGERTGLLTKDRETVERPKCGSELSISKSLFLEVLYITFSGTRNFFID